MMCHCRARPSATPVSPAASINAERRERALSYAQRAKRARKRPSKQTRFWLPYSNRSAHNKVVRWSHDYETRWPSAMLNAQRRARAL